MKIRVYVKKNEEGNFLASVEGLDIKFLAHAYDASSTGKNQILEFLHLVESTATNFVLANTDITLPTTVLVALNAVGVSKQD